MNGPPEMVTLLYEGWQVWDGEFGVVRVGGEVLATIEFGRHSPLRDVATGSPLGIEQLDGARYLATAKVLDTSDAVVLDLGSLKAIQWIRPRESAGPFTTGATVSLELTLGFNGWPDSPWTDRATDLYGIDHRWLVHRITRLSASGDDAPEIDEAATETVDPASEYCLVRCSLVE